MNSLQSAFERFAAIPEHPFDLSSDVNPIDDRSDRTERHAIRHPIEHPRVLLIDALKIMLVAPRFKWPRFLLIHETSFLPKHHRVRRAMLDEPCDHSNRPERPARQDADFPINGRRKIRVLDFDPIRR